MTEYEDPAGESKLRRRAAWLLGTLVVVAALLVAVMLLFLNSGGSGQPSPKGIKPLPTAPPSTAAQQHSVAATGTSHTPAPSSAAHTTRPHRAAHTIRPHRAAHTHRPSGHPVTEPPRVVHHRVSCPGEAPCIAHGDIGNAVAAINAYRVRHGERAVSGAVTPTAQACAVTNGGRCTGNWAETEVPNATGAAVARKVAALTNLLDPKLASLQVGWAYNPAAHAYYFAVIRNDS